VIRGFEEFWAAHTSCALRGRDRILSSICPQICGLSVVKLAMALMLIGGQQRVDANGTRIRGEVHMLLVGDPGTGGNQRHRKNGPMLAAKQGPYVCSTCKIGTKRIPLVSVVQFQPDPQASPCCTGGPSSPPCGSPPCLVGLGVCFPAIVRRLGYWFPCHGSLAWLSVP
jgi:MCM P-loop domain